MKRLLESISSFYRREYDDDSGVKVPEDMIIPLCYTTYDFDDGVEHEVQVSVDCKNVAYLNYIDDELVLTEERSSLLEIAEEIEGCNFEDIIRECVYKGFDVYGK